MEANSTVTFTSAGIKWPKNTPTLQSKLSRIEQLIESCETLKKEIEESNAEHSDRITETSNVLHMTHDYVTGLHYSLVEHGGFLRNGFGFVA